VSIEPASSSDMRACSVPLSTTGVRPTICFGVS
jgi:hypothetical protein